MRHPRLSPDRPSGRPRPRIQRWRWTVPTTLSALWALIAFIGRVVAPYAPDRQEREDVLLAVVEGMSNAFKSTMHTPGHRLVVGLTVSARGLRVSIKDLGAGFDRPVSPVSLAADHQEQGRGLFLIQRVMDRVAWSEQGNAITMVRRWRGAPLPVASEP